MGLVTQKLSDSQWEVMEEINKSLTQEYSTRRQMLLTRCDVTIQSFGWSEKVKVRPHPLPRHGHMTWDLDMCMGCSACVWVAWHVLCMYVHVKLCANNLTGLEPHHVFST